MLLFADHICIFKRQREKRSNGHYKSYRYLITPIIIGTFNQSVVNWTILYNVVYKENMQEQGLMV